MNPILTLLAIPIVVVALAACDSDHHHRHVTTQASTQVSPPPPTTTTTAPTTAAAPTTPAAPATGPSASSTVSDAANPSGMLAFTQNKLSAKAGKVTIDFTNKAPVPHDFVLIDSPSYSASAKTLGQTPIFQGGTKTFTVTLTAGTYYFYCSVPGHRQAGMFGTLTVTGAAPAAAAPSHKKAGKVAAAKTASKPAAAAVSTVNIAASTAGMLAFTQKSLSAKAGKVTLDFTNHSPIPHDLVLIDSSSYSASAKVLGKTPIFQGGMKSFTVTLKSGTYYYYCSVPGHRQAGMYGTLTVS